MQTDLQKAQRGLLRRDGQYALLESIDLGEPLLLGLDRLVHQTLEILDRVVKLRVVVLVLVFFVLFSQLGATCVVVSRAFSV